MWPSFKSAFNQTEPIKFSRPADFELPSEQTLLKCLKDTLENAIENGKQFSMSIVVDGKGLDFSNRYEIEPFIPKSTDANLKQYHNRISNHIENKDYFVYLSHLGSNDASLWPWRSKMVEMVEGHFDEEFLSVSMDFIIGCYQDTPGRIHVDHLNVLYCVLDGMKKMHFWEPETIEESHLRDNIVQYDDNGSQINNCTNEVVEEFLPKAKCSIEIEDKDLLFWPGRLWHFARQPSEFSAAVCINWKDTKQGEGRVNSLTTLATKIIPPIIERKEPLDFKKVNKIQVSKSALLSFLTHENTVEVQSNGHRKKVISFDRNLGTLLDAALQKGKCLYIDELLEGKIELNQFNIKKVLIFLWKTRALDVYQEKA